VRKFHHLPSRLEPEGIMKPEDYEAPPCSCPECTQAGVTDLPLRRDPWSGEWLHGYKLTGWYDAKRHFDEMAKRIKAKSREEGA
jgi:hypothetical protein